MSVSTYYLSKNPPMTEAERAQYEAEIAKQEAEIERLREEIYKASRTTLGNTYWMDQMMEAAGFRSSDMVSLQDVVDRIRCLRVPHDNEYRGIALDLAGEVHDNLDALATSEQWAARWKAAAKMYRDHYQDESNHYRHVLGQIVDAVDDMTKPVDESFRIICNILNWEGF